MVATRRACTGTNTAGQPCQSPIVGRDGYCDAHRPGGEAEMKRRALKGAIKAQLAKGLKPRELGPLKSHADAERWLRIVGEAVATGRLGHQEGRTTVSAVREWVKAHTDGAMAQQLEALREQLEEVKKRKLTAI